MQEKFDALVRKTDEFCQKNLNNDYAVLARRAVAALCRKRNSPVAGGKDNVWACAVIYALGQNNFLSDKNTEPHMRMDELCRLFGAGKSTVSAKAREIRDALGMDSFNPDWMLPDMIEKMATLWMVSINGFIVDIRSMPLAVQEDACSKGLIPYVPASSKTHPHQEKRDQMLAEYAKLRKINVYYQSKLAAELLEAGSVAETAKKLGIMDEDGLVFADEGDDVINCLAPAFDILVYTASKDGASYIKSYAKKHPARPALNKKVIDAMENAFFSLFRIEGRHGIAGVMLWDMLNGGEVWLMDRTLEAAAESGMIFGARIFKPADFYMSTGVVVPTGFGVMGNEPIRTSGSTINPHQLAEELYRNHFGKA